MILLDTSHARNYKVIISMHKLKLYYCGYYVLIILLNLFFAKLMHKKLQCFWNQYYFYDRKLYNKM